MQGIAKCRYNTNVLGTAPAKGYTQILLDYIEGRMDKEFLTFAQQAAKKNQTIEKVATDILSLFHRDNDGNIVVGSWMMKRCLIDTGMIYFKSKEHKEHPIKKVIPYLVQVVEPYYIKLTNGNGEAIREPIGVDTYAVNSKGRNFFKAYEYLPPGTEFEFEFHVDDEVLTKEVCEWWVHKAGVVGNYAFRERFGKFDILKLEISGGEKEEETQEAA